MKETSRLKEGRPKIWGDMELHMSKESLDAVKSKPTDENLKSAFKVVSFLKLIKEVQHGVFAENKCTANHHLHSSSTKYSNSPSNCYSPPSTLHNTLTDPSPHSLSITFIDSPPATHQPSCCNCNAPYLHSPFIISINSPLATHQPSCCC